MRKRRKPLRPFVIGLVGGVASGKSHVGRAFESAGAVRIDADLLGHQVLERPLVIRMLTQIFGHDIVDGEGKIVREKLGQLVFGNDSAARDARRQLEAIVHPLIHAEAVHQLQNLKDHSTPPLAVLIDAPLLLEADWEPLCDAVLFVDTPLEVRQQRAEARQWSAEELDKREASQLPLAEKRSRATHVVAGDLKPDELERYAIGFLEEVKRAFAS